MSSEKAEEAGVLVIGKEKNVSDKDKEAADRAERNAEAHIAMEEALETRRARRQVRPQPREREVLSLGEALLLEEQNRVNQEMRLEFEEMQKKEEEQEEQMKKEEEEKEVAVKAKMKKEEEEEEEKKVYERCMARIRVAEAAQCPGGVRGVSKLKRARHLSEFEDSQLEVEDSLVPEETPMVSYRTGYSPTELETQSDME